MNKKQRRSAIVLFWLFLLSVCLAPWKVVEKSQGHVYRETRYYQPVFVAPDVDQSQRKEAILDWSPLLCTWLALGISYAGLFFIFRHQNRPCQRKLGGSRRSGTHV